MDYSMIRKQRQIQIMKPQIEEIDNRSNLEIDNKQPSNYERIFIFE